MRPKKNKNHDLERKRKVFFQIGLITAMSLSILAFEWRVPHDNEKIDYDSVQIVEPTYHPVNTVREPEVKVVQILPIDWSHEFTITKEEVDEVIEQEKPEEKTVDSCEDCEIDYHMNTDDDPEDPSPIPTLPPSWAEIMPEFPGGDEARLLYLARNVKYPGMDREVGIQGKVYISFVVDKEGNIKNIKLLGLRGGATDRMYESAVRAIERMPRWKPGSMGGIPIAVTYQTEIKFILE